MWIPLTRSEDNELILINLANIVEIRTTTNETDYAQLYYNCVDAQGAQPYQIVKESLMEVYSLIKAAERHGK